MSDPTIRTRVVREPRIRARVQGADQRRIRVRVLPSLLPKEPTIEVGTVTTLAPGAPATVENVGTAQDAVFDFGIPAGEPGADGADGAGQRTSLTADTTYHCIDYPSPMGVGGDTGTGTAIDPFVGPQYALDWLQKNIDTAGFDVRLEIDSDVATENAPDGFTALMVDYEPLVGGGGFTLAQTGSHKTTCATAGSGIVSQAPLLRVETFDFDGVDDGVYFSHISAGAGEVDAVGCRFGKAGFGDQNSAAIAGAAVAVSGPEIYGGAAHHLYAPGGEVTNGGSHILTGAPAFSVAFVEGNYSAKVILGASYSGSATGIRYIGLTGTSILATNTLPGDAPGTLDATSSYNGVFGAASVAAGNTVIETGNGPFTVADDTSILILNRGTPGASAVTLGSVAARAALPLDVFDWAGNAGDITVTPDGSETIMGLSTWTLGSSADSKAGKRFIPNTDLSGWLTGP